VRQKNLFSLPFFEAESEDSAGGDMDYQSLLADLCSPPGVWVGERRERREEGVICGHVTTEHG